MLKRTLLLAILLLPPASAHAAWPVIDWSNLAQSIQQVQHMAQMLQQQQQQLQNEIQMLTQGGQLITLDQQMLAKFGGNYLAQITSIIQGIDGLIQAAGGLTYDLANLGSAFESSYRPAFGSMSSPQLLAQRGQLRTLLLDTVKESMTIQSRVTANMGANRSQLENLVTASQTAPGQTAAIQAGNQLLAQLGSQLVEIQALLASQSKATEAATAHQLAEEERARELARKSMIDKPVTYTPVGNPFSRVQ